MSRSQAEWVLLFAFTGALVGACRGADKAGEPYPYREIRCPQGAVGGPVFSPDASLMAAGAGDVVVVWNVADGKEIQRMQLPDKQISYHITFAEDGKTLIWNGRQDPMIRVFDVKTGKQLREFAQPNGTGRKPFSSHFLAYSPDGKRMAFHGPNFFQGVDVLDVATGEIVLQLKDVEDCRGCAFSADGKLIATNSTHGGVRVWDAATGKLLHELRADNRFAAGAFALAAFSPDGQWLATAGHVDKSLNVWNVQTGKLACTLTSTAFYRSAVFSEDNRTLLCLPAATGEAVLHNLVAEKDVYTFNPPARLTLSATFTPGGKYAAISGPSSDGGSSGVAGQYSIYLYELPASAFDPAVAHIDDVPSEKLWAELSGDNELRLELVHKALRTAPKQTVELFAKQMQPVSKEARQQVEDALADLDDDAFTKRDEATKKLQALAQQFSPLLESKLKQAPAGEVRNRLTLILKRVSGEKTPEPLLTELRALALLEQIDSPEARDLLSHLAGGAPQARLTVEAQAALDRLNNKSKPPPP